VSERAIVAAAVDCRPARVTRSLLGYGALAGPFYVLVALAQAALRPGFDLARDDVSLLSNGQLGWIQVANFVVTGLMVLACAVGVGRALAGGRGATWAPRLLGFYGLGLIGAGVFVADPMNGFPHGTPAGRPETLTLHGTLHVVVAAIGFLGLVAACAVLARRFASEQRRGWAAFSLATAVVFLAGFVGVASGSGSPVMVVAFWAALVVAWTWLGAVSIHLYRRLSGATGGA
jgi:hypothetical membrane protein